MCVLTYIKSLNNEIFITSNRDEKVLRQTALAPRKYKSGKTELIGPIDPVSKGTWIATSKNYTAVLLNGGFVNHISQAPYKHSRGRVILDFALNNNVLSFFENYDFENIEPFTLVVFEHTLNNAIHEIKWCTGKKHLISHNPDEAHIWSSATLYSPEAILNRSNWFYETVANHKTKIESQVLLDFHLNGGKADLHNSIFLNRNNELKTLSTTQIYIATHSKTMFYYDYVNEINKTFQLY